MLDPDDRRLLTAALAPPDGMHLSEAVATTYGLDLTKLVSIAPHLVPGAMDDPASVGEDPAATLHGLRETMHRLMVFAAHGQIPPPNVPLELAPLLEPVVVPAAAPLGGAFHAKLWVIRYESAESTILRTLVLTGNLTRTRSWDLMLQLEGSPAEVSVPENEPLAQLLVALPRCALTALTADATARLERLAHDVRHTNWVLPEGYDQLRFHVLGLDGAGWLPARNDRLLVISPFCNPTVLARLAERTSEAVALVAEPGPAESSGWLRFGRLLVLADEAAIEESEATEPPQSETPCGLHAKAYLWETGGRFYIAMGSANATHSGLLSGQNVELLAELSGPRRALGGIDDVLSADSLGALLREPPVTDGVEHAIDDSPAVKASVEAILRAPWQLHCEPDSALWQLTVVPERPTQAGDIGELWLWPVTIPEAHAVSALCVLRGESVRFRSLPAASLTRFIGAKIVVGGQTFFRTLILPAQGIPDDRDAAVMRLVLRNREGFQRYLVRLLSEPEDVWLWRDVTLWPREPGRDRRPHAETHEDALLELLVRALGRDEERLRSVRSLVDGLRRTHGGEDLLPDGFLQVWERFEAFLERHR